MAEAAATLGLKTVPLVVDHYEKVYDPVKNKTKQGVQKVREMRTRNGGYESEEDDYYEEYDGPPRRARSGGGRQRSDRGDVVEERYVHRGNGRASSVGRDRYSRGSRRDYSDSESSRSPPPSRRRRKSLGEKALVALGLGGAAGAGAEKERERRRSKSRSRRDRSLSSDSDGGRSRQVTRSRTAPQGGYYDEDDRTPSRYKPSTYGGGGSEYGSSNNNNQIARRDNRGDVGSHRGGGAGSGRGRSRSRSGGSRSRSRSSSSDVCSSSEDERRTRRMKGKEYLTAGLAAVATIHAAHNVYNSMEARDKRHQQVMNGSMTPEEARKLKNKARLQDAAAIGIAALGIKGAYSEWKEVQEHRHELAEQQKSRQERHEKRLRKAEKYGSRNKSVPDMRRDRDRDDRYDRYD